MKIGVIGVTLLCCIVLAVSVSAFDGNRKGFVLGGGVGFTPNVNESGKGLAGDFIIGSGLSDKIVAVWSINGMWGHYSHIDENVLRFYSGVAWYYYFNNEHPSYYLTVAHGRYGTGRIDEDGKFSTIFLPTGYMVGGGYEFKKHFMAGLYFSGSWHRINSLERIGVGRYHISFLVTAFAY